MDQGEGHEVVDRNRLRNNRAGVKGGNEEGQDMSPFGLPSVVVGMSNL